MAETLPPHLLKPRVHLRLVRFPQSRTKLDMRETSDPGRLISSRDAAISTSLQDQTQFALATLTPRERLVLSWRFGIAQIGDQQAENIDKVLRPGEIALIEAAALRKLRHPSQGVRLRTFDTNDHH